MRNRRFIQIATIVIVALVAVAFLANRALPSSPGSNQAVIASEAVAELQERKHARE